jgi:phage terminase large subunit-like protein
MAVDASGASGAGREVVPVASQLATFGDADRDKSTFYRPTAKQIEFHAAGATARERLFLAGNQLGKTTAGAFELAYHLTGRYPPWWEGRRFEGPVVAWAAGVTAETTRDNPQRLLLGRAGAFGGGAIPRECIIETEAARGVAGALDQVHVRHVGGGVSQLAFKSYGRGREGWQGATLDLVWFDEEPPYDVYTEGLTRTNRTGGLVYATLTPLLGRTALVDRFLSRHAAERALIRLTLDEATQYSVGEKGRILDAYATHERDARARGLPRLGEGRVFVYDESDLIEDAPVIDRNWAQICGVDFGIDHPTAAVWLAHDRDGDVVHIYAAYCRRNEAIDHHAAAIRARGSWIPVAWPRDGRQRSQVSGEPIAAAYRRAGVNMLSEPASFEDGSNRLENGIAEMADRIATGRLKVARSLGEWLHEYRMYHRKDGRIVKENDDLLSATRYALMMLRHAKSPAEQERPRPLRADGNYDPFRW